MTVKVEHWAVCDQCGKRERAEEGGGWYGYQHPTTWRVLWWKVAPLGSQRNVFLCSKACVLAYVQSDAGH